MPINEMNAFMFAHYKYLNEIELEPDFGPVVGTTLIKVTSLLEIITSIERDGVELKSTVKF